MNLNELKQRVITKTSISTVDEINNLLLKQAASWKKSSSFAHKPSNLGSECLRRLYYDYFRVDSDVPNDARGLKILDTGNMFEDLIVGWLKKLNKFIPYVPQPGQRVYDEQFVVHSPRWRVKMGKIDSVAVTEEGIWLYEIKSCNENKFKSLFKPVDEHIVQGAIYLQCFNDLYLQGYFDHMPEIKGKGKALGIRYIYVNKNTSELKEFVLRVQDLITTILNLDKKIMIVNSYIDRKELPPCKKSVCKYCPYPTKCKSNWNNVDK